MIVSSMKIRVFINVGLGMVLGFFAFLGLPSCSRWEGGRTLTLAAYTAPREAFREINRLFEDQWRREKGESIRVKESFLSSGGQARAVIDGFPADVVALALAVDVDRIQEAKLINHPWRTAPHEGMVTRSVVAFAVREGNPKGVQDWKDLLQPGLEVLTPNPKTSGGARWNVLAAYGAVLRGHVPGFSPDEAGAMEFLVQLLRHVTAMDKGARESLVTFERGLGDVALSYENEILEGRSQHERYELKIPSSTLLIENPVALVDKNIEAHGNRDIAEAYLKFLFSPEAQKLFAKHGFRPVDPAVFRQFSGQYGPLQDVFTIREFGGWHQVLPRFFQKKGVFVEAAERAQKDR